MIRNLIYKIFFVGALMLGLGISQVNRPNIVFIMADDLGYADIGVNGQQDIKTPNLDKMAGEGLKFTQFYTGTPVCGPARCNLMTGMHNGHCRFRNNGQHNALWPEDVTIGEVLGHAGYISGAFGKWGLGQRDSTGNPLLQGFTRFYGYLDQLHAHNFYPTYLNDNNDTAWLQNVNPGQGARGQGDAPENGEIDYSHTFIANEALKFIDTYKDTSFFLYIPFTIPHLNNEGSGAADGGYEVPSLGQYASQANWTIPMKSLAAMITLMDEDIGKLFDKLKEHNIDSNTIVFFTSDNGPTFLRIGPNQLPDGTPLSADERIVANWFDSNGQYRGFKQDTFEGGIRMPMFVRWPGVIRENDSTDQKGYHPDILVTLADLAGVSSPTNTDGISLAPTLLGNTQVEQHDHFFWRLAADKAVLKDNWKLVVEGGTTRLYDIDIDPGENTNLLNQYPAVVQELTNIMNAEDAGVVVANWTPALKDPAYVSIEERKEFFKHQYKILQGNEFLSITGSGTSTENIRITNMLGEIVYQKNNFTFENINTKNMNNGIYTIMVMNGGSVRWLQNFAVMN